MIKLFSFRFSSISQLIHNLSSREKDISCIEIYQQNLLELQDKIHQEIKERSLNDVIQDQLKQRPNPFDIYNYYMLLRFLNIDYNQGQCLQLLSYIYNSMQIQKSYEDKDIIFGLLKQQIKESEKKLLLNTVQIMDTAPAQSVPIKYLFNLLNLFWVIFDNQVIPLQSIEILTDRIQIINEIDFSYLVSGVQKYVENCQDIFPQRFWKSFFDACDRHAKILQTNSHIRRQLLEILQSTSKMVNYQLYEKVIKYELEFHRSSDYINLNQIITLLKTISILQINYPNQVPHMNTIRQLFENQKFQQQLLNQIKEGSNNVGVQHLTSFLFNHQIQFDGLSRQIEHQNIQSLDGELNNSLVNINTKEINANLSLLLKQGLTDLSQQEISLMRNIIIKIFENELDQNTLKKVMVLACQLYPDDIKIIQLSLQKAREYLLTSSGSKEDVSLAINALFQMEKVQYNLPFISKVFIEHIIKYLTTNKDLVFTLNPQELSSIYYYISKQEKKQNKTELLIKESQPSKIDETIYLLSELLQLLIPQVQYLCSKNLLKIKVLYTIIDCYSKYRKYLQEINLKYLFEKIEFNLMNEIKNEIQFSRQIAPKDLKFLYQRFFYLKVGSRKLHRFLKAATQSLVTKQDPNRKLPAKQSNIVKAVKLYKRREKVYQKMRQRRQRAIFASSSI